MDEREMIEESIKTLNKEEYEAFDVDRELDNVADVIKKLVSPSSPPNESSMRETTPDLEMSRMSRNLVNKVENPCNQIFLTFSELEREEDTKQKLILIRRITEAETDTCSPGEGEGCKTDPKVCVGWGVGFGCINIPVSRVQEYDLCQKTKIKFSFCTLLPVSC